MSPLASCAFAAVSGWTSTHACQVIFETGSGSSWSHGLFAPRPSSSAIDGKTISRCFSDAPAEPARPPSRCAIPETSRTLCAGASAYTPPCCTASLQKSSKPRPRPNRSCSVRHRVCRYRSEEHTSELQSLRHLVCRLLLEKKIKGCLGLSANVHWPPSSKDNLLQRGN